MEKLDKSLHFNDELVIILFQTCKKIMYCISYKTCISLKIDINIFIQWHC